MTLKTNSLWSTWWSRLRMSNSGPQAKSGPTVLLYLACKANTQSTARAARTPLFHSSQICVIVEQITFKYVSYLTLPDLVQTICTKKDPQHPASVFFFPSAVTHQHNSYHIIEAHFRPSNEEPVIFPPLPPYYAPTIHTVFIVCACSWELNITLSLSYLNTASLLLFHFLPADCTTA